MILDPSMFQSRDHKPAAKGKKKRQGRLQSPEVDVQVCDLPLNKGGKGMQGGATSSHKPGVTPQDRQLHRRFH